MTFTHHVASFLSIGVSIVFESVFSLFHWDRNIFIQRLARKLSSANVLYVKLFQAIALNKNLIDDNTNKTLMKFTDEAPYDDDDIDLQLLLDIVREESLTLYSNQPIKSGMISLIFKVYDNKAKQDRILKMKRKNIDYRLSESIQSVRLFATIWSWMPYLSRLDLLSLLDNNIDILRNQLDFRKEVHNMMEAATFCKDLNYVKVPSVVESVTDKYENAILMEYLDGVTIDKVSKDDYETYASILVKYGITSLLIHGVTHGDLHGGNIIFLKQPGVASEAATYQLGLIDFGVVLRLEESYRLDFLSLASDVFTAPARTVAKKVLAMNLEPKGILDNIPEESCEKILGGIVPIIDETVHKSADQSRLYECLVQLGQVLTSADMAKYGIRISSGLVKVQMALAMCNGLNMTLSGNEYIKYANKTVSDMFHLDLLTEEEEEEGGGKDELE